jgi:murein DD-endopeptidase MepM/ murein hydrolase activator NlpD
MMHKILIVLFGPHRFLVLFVAFVLTSEGTVAGERINTIWPIDTNHGSPLLSTPYGPIDVYDPDYSGYRFHTGVDLKGAYGTPVKAVYRAQVFRVDYRNDPYDNLQAAPILIHYSDAGGSQTVAAYAHLGPYSFEVVEGT